MSSDPGMIQLIKSKEASDGPKSRGSLYYDLYYENVLERHFLTCFGRPAEDIRKPGTL